MGLRHVCEVSFFNEVVYSGLGGGLRLPGAVLCAVDKRRGTRNTRHAKGAHMCAFMKELH